MKLTRHPRSRGFAALTATTATIALLLGASAPAQAAPPAQVEKVSTSQFTDESCVKQVEQAYKKVGQTATRSDLKVCSGKVTVEEGPAQTVNVNEARSMAASEGMTNEEATQVVQAAAAGKIKSRKWKHAYWGGSNYEKHSGRTYWDGSKAWVKKYRGKTGYHTCHSEGSWQVGWAVKPISCTKPKAGKYADSAYRFDASLFVKGSPITLGVGLHYRTSKTGAVKTWQVGG